MPDHKLQRITKLLDKVTIVLVAPKYAENVGAAARVACNMGISRLALVRDEMPEQEAMARMATHHAIHLIDNIELHTTLAEAVSSCNWVVATSARRGRQRFFHKDPRHMVADLIPRLDKSRVALVFGPEHRGLTNDDLSLCNATVTIATAEFSSLNLAQSVGVICHELFSSLWQQKKSPAAKPKSAPSHAVQAMYGELEETLQQINYLDAKEYGYWMHNFKHFFNRVGLRGREVRFISGFCRQVQWLAAGRPEKKK